MAIVKIRLVHEDDIEVVVSQKVLGQANNTRKKQVMQANALQRGVLVRAYNVVNV